MSSALPFFNEADSWSRLARVLEKVKLKAEEFQFRTWTLHSSVWILSEINEWRTMLLVPHHCLLWHWQMSCKNIVFERGGNTLAMLNLVLLKYKDGLFNLQLLKSKCDEDHHNWVCYEIKHSKCTTLFTRKLKGRMFLVHLMCAIYCITLYLPFHWSLF